MNRESYDFIFENMKDAVVILASKGPVIYANHAAAEIFDCPAEEMQGKRLPAIIPQTYANDDFIQLFIDAVMDKSSTHEAIVDYERSDGSIYKLRVCISYSRGEEESSITVAITNLTELIRVNSALVRYTSREIASEILREDGEALGGRTREVTVLMSDLRGFTALSTRLSPVELITLLNHYFEAMIKIIDRYRGTVIEFLGDGIFVIFGAPAEQPNHAAAAAACALEMQKAMEEVNLWNAEHGFPVLQMGIGINSGDAVVGNIGSALRTKYGCMGENVNLAGRAESFTVGGQIFITQYTKDRIREELTFAGSQSFVPKGGREPLMIYDLTGIGGEYGIECPRKEIIFDCLSSPAEVRFYLLAGKAVTGAALTGRIAAVSKDYGHLLLRTGTALEKSGNLMLEAGGSLYAKVIEIREDGAVLNLTSKPAGFEEWIQSIK